MSNLFTFILLKNLKNIYSHKLSQDPTFCLKNEKWEEGFSILEVLVTILVITGFVLGSLQATVLATLLRVQAQDKQEATNWLQQDLELIRYQAFILDNPTETSGLTPSQANACDNSKYGTRLQDFIDGTYPNTSDIDINGKSYDVARAYTAPENILQVSYTISYDSTHPRYKSGGDNVVTTLSTEVLPNAALSCS
ncbi:type IV pilus modification PilV family protein [Cyanobacterium aponinum]|uniref:type IV pilus modification PilV family protein n=1 Tax=Cyanobacterium aponinum TaxID=379064 RepID=UPI000C12AD96|nr:hypothetical protein [Cyanobacterium aponinum]PHV64050.1 hypothetical protein CSQ80_02035 [Cyanobacterium aponinum IPPAS B-1201]